MGIVHRLAGLKLDLGKFHDSGVQKERKPKNRILQHIFNVDSVQTDMIQRQCAVEFP